MDVNEARVAELLQTARVDYGTEVAETCRELIVALPPNAKFRPFLILTEARYRL